jgi:hypothetical protein
MRTSRYAVVVNVLRSGVRSGDIYRRMEWPNQPRGEATDNPRIQSLSSLIPTQAGPHCWVPSSLWLKRYWMPADERPGPQGERYRNSEMSIASEGQRGFFVRNRPLVGANASPQALLEAELLWSAEDEVRHRGSGQLMAQKVIPDVERRASRRSSYRRWLS